MTVLLILLAILLLAALAPVLGADRRDLTSGPRLLGDARLPERHA